jgi:hypothetical protein
VYITGLGLIKTVPHLHFFSCFFGRWSIPSFPVASRKKKEEEKFNNLNPLEDHEAPFLIPLIKLMETNEN